MSVQVIDRQPTPIAYLRHVGPYGPPVTAFWQETVYPWMVANDFLQRPRYGISHDDPAITAEENCRYDAGVALPAGFAATGRMLTTTLPGGRYAVSKFEGTTDEIVAAWARVLREWLPASGMQLDSRPFFEHYPEGTKWDPETGIFDCEICIPVVEL